MDLVQQTEPRLRLPLLPAMLWLGAGIPLALLAPKPLLAILAGMALVAALTYLCFHVLFGEAQWLVPLWALVFPAGYYFLVFPRAKPLVTLDRMLVALVICGAVCAVRPAVAVLTPGMRKAAMAWGVFLAGCAVSMVQSHSRMSAMRLLTDAFVLPAIFGWFVYRWFPAREHTRSLHAAVCLALLFMAGVGFAEVATFEDIFAFEGGAFFGVSSEDGTLAMRVNGPFSTNNSFSLIGATSIFLLVHLRRMIGSGISRGQQWLHRAGMFAAVLAAVMPLFRSVLATLLLVVLLEAWESRRDKRKLMLVSGTVAIAAVLLAIRMFMPVVFEDRVANPTNIWGRLAQQVQNLKVFAINPVIGVGLTNFMDVAATVEMPEFSEVKAVDSAHSNFGSVLAETGILGFFPYCATVVLTLLAAQELRSGRNLRTYRLFFAVYLIYWLNGLSLTSGYYADLNMWFMFTMALMFQEMALNAGQANNESQV